MKKIVYILFLFGLLFVNSSCEETDYQKLFPAEVHKILYLKNSGFEDVTIYRDGTVTEYPVTIVKAGSELATTANVQLRVLTQKELDEDAGYAGSSYKVLSANCFKLSADAIEFASTDFYKIANLRLDPAAIDNEISAGSATDVFILPLRLSSSVDSINSEKSDLLIKPTVVAPSVSFDGKSEAVNMHNVKDSEDGYAVSYVVKMDGINNKWNFTVPLSVGGQNVIDEYNAANGTEYQVAPEGAYVLDPAGSLSFDVEKNEVTGTVILHRSKMVKGEKYLIPLMLGDCDNENIKTSKTPYYLIADYGFTKLAITAEMLSSNSVHPSDGGGLAALVDNDPESYYHSNYNTPTDGKGYGIYIDVHLKTPVQSVMFEYIGRNTNWNPPAPKKIYLYVSNDGTSWTKIAEKTDGLPEGQAATYKSDVFEAGQTFTYIRFSVTSAYFHDSIGDGVNSDVFSLAELSFWGL